MPQQLFYVSHAGQQVGPLAIDEIVERVKSSQLEAGDYLFDEAMQDWVMLMAHPHLFDSLKALRPAHGVVPFRTTATRPEGPLEWYVLKGDLRFGPFAYSEVVRMLQDKSVYESDYVWQASMKTWERASSLKEFSPDSIRALRESGMEGLNEVFFRRRHARVGVDVSILVHNNKTVFKGKSCEISEGGAGLLLSTSALETGHKVFLHFKPDSELPSFNATCEVVSKRAMSSTDKSAPFHYGIKFLKIDQVATQQIHELAKRRRTAA